MGFRVRRPQEAARDNHRGARAGEEAGAIATPWHWLANTAERRRCLHLSAIPSAIAEPECSGLQVGWPGAFRLNYELSYPAIEPTLALMNSC
jgi:hypothetical protein